MHVTQVMTNGGNADDIINNIPSSNPFEQKANLRHNSPNGIIVPMNHGFSPVRMFSSKF